MVVSRRLLAAPFILFFRSLRLLIELRSLLCIYSIAFRWRLFVISLVLFTSLFNMRTVCLATGLHALSLVLLCLPRQSRVFSSLNTFINGKTLLLCLQKRSDSHFFACKRPSRHPRLWIKLTHRVKLCVSYRILYEISHLTVFFVLTATVNTHSNYRHFLRVSVKSCNEAIKYTHTHTPTPVYSLKSEKRYLVKEKEKRKQIKKPIK